MNIGKRIHLLRHRLGVAVEAAIEVGLVPLLEADSAVHRVGGVVLVVSYYESKDFINATRCKHSQGDVALPARIALQFTSRFVFTNELGVDSINELSESTRFKYRPKWIPESSIFLQ